MHDGAHHSYSRHKTVNGLMAFTLDCIGGSHVLWRQKHNRWHHTFTNIHGIDADLSTAGLFRLSPEQPWSAWHRWQHLYAVRVYSLVTLSWVLYGDVRAFVSGILAHTPSRARHGWKLVSLWAPSSCMWAICWCSLPSSIRCCTCCWRLSPCICWSG